MNMSRYISKSVLFVAFIVIVCGGLYPPSLEEYFEPQAVSTSAAAAVSNDPSHQQNVDSAVAATPSLDPPTQKLCYFYDC